MNLWSTPEGVDITALADPVDGERIWLVRNEDRSADLGEFTYYIQELEREALSVADELIGYWTEGAIEVLEVVVVKTTRVLPELDEEE